MAIPDDADAHEELARDNADANDSEEQYASDSDKGSESSSNAVHVQLGFVRVVKSRQVLRSDNFPSKVGGFPAWLDYKNIPRVSKMLCQYCGNRLTFLLQVYAPVDPDDAEHHCAFHRSLYLFCCKSDRCQGGQGKFKVLRSQLPRSNEFYSYEPPDMNNIRTSEERNRFEAFQCAVCGFRGPLRCGKCRQAQYCSADCQRRHWNLGHRSACQGKVKAQGTTGKTDKVKQERALLLFPVYEIRIAPHPPPANDDLGKAMPEENRTGTLQNVDQSEMPDESIQNMSDRVDRDFLSFQERIRLAPSQILRYDRGGSPLWPSKNGRCLDAGSCQICSRPRIFEFQVMPQLLYYLRNSDGNKAKPKSIADVKNELDSNLDWGTLAVYTCPVSCQTKGDDNLGTYVEELVWWQSGT